MALLHLWNMENESSHRHFGIALQWLQKAITVAIIIHGNFQDQDLGELCSWLCVLLRVTIAVMKLHDQKQVGGYFACTSTS